MKNKKKAFLMIELIVSAAIFAAALPILGIFFFKSIQIPHIDQNAVCIAADIDNCLTNSSKISNKEKEVCAIFFQKKYKVIKESLSKNFYTFTIKKHPCHSGNITFCSYISSGEFPRYERGLVDYE